MRLVALKYYPKQQQHNHLKIIGKFNSLSIVIFPFSTVTFPVVPLMECIIIRFNIMSTGRNFCNKVFVIRNSMEILYISLRKSLKIQTSLIFSNELLIVSKSRV